MMVRSAARCCVTSLTLASVTLTQSSVPLMAQPAVMASGALTGTVSVTGWLQLPQVRTSSIYDLVKI